MPIFGITRQAKTPSFKLQNSHSVTTFVCSAMLNQLGEKLWLKASTLEGEGYPVHETHALLTKDSELQRYDQTISLRVRCLRC